MAEKGEGFTRAEGIKALYLALDSQSGMIALAGQVLEKLAASTGEPFPQLLSEWTESRKKNLTDAITRLGQGSPALARELNEYRKTRTADLLPGRQ